MLKRVGAAALLAVAVTAAGPAGAKELFFYNWSNYFPPDLLKKFEAETGIRTTLDVYDSNETLLAKLQAGAAGYDIVVPSDYMIPVMVRDGMLERIDAKAMPNFGNIAPNFLGLAFDPERAYTVPYMWGTTGFTYDSKRVPGGKLEESWKAFFEPPAALAGLVGDSSPTSTTKGVSP